MSFISLPPEILYNVLSYLSIPSLLSFAATSQDNYIHHLHTLHTLHLAVFPKKVQCLIAFLQQSSTSTFDQENQKSITLRHKPTKTSSPKSYRNHVVSSQNTHLNTLLARYGPSLQNLTFHAWDLLPESVSVLASRCASLKHLALCFEHSASRDPCIPAGYFDAAPKPSTLWNGLAGLGGEAEKALVIRNLVSLRLERAGTTSAQLRSIVIKNPGLSELRFRKVSGVDNEFVNWLGGGQNVRKGNVKVLALEDCAGLECRTEEALEWVESLTSLTSLSFDGCVAVDGRLVRIINERRWKIKDLVGWGGNWSEGDLMVEKERENDVLEVDETCL